MPDDQGTSNDVVEEGADADYDGNDGNDINDIIGTTTPPAQIIDDGGNSVVDDDVEDEPLPDVTVNLYINDEADGLVIPNDLVNAGLTDEYGNFITPTTPSLSDSINDYTASISQGVYDELTTNGTNIGGKQWWGSWTWHKTLLVVLIALCIIGIILALVFLIIGKKKNKKNNRPQQPAAGPKTTKSAVQKGISPNPEYSPVPTSV